MDERERRHRKLRELWDGVARRSESAAEPACPDSEILSAYFMHMLGEEEVAQWEAHFSVCSACQEALAALVKTASMEETDLASERIRERELGDIGERVDAAAQLSRFSESEPALFADRTMAAAPATPVVVSKGVAIEPPAAKPSRRERFSLRWFVPAVAAAAVLAVWLTVRLERPGSQSGAPIAENKPATQPANPNPLESAPAAPSTAAVDKEKRETTRLGAASGDVASADSALASKGAAQNAAEPSPSVTTETDVLRAAKGAEAGSKIAATLQPSPASVTADTKIETADRRQAAMNKLALAPPQPAVGAAGTFPDAAPSQQRAEKLPQKAAVTEERANSEAPAPELSVKAKSEAAGGATGGLVQTPETTKRRMIANVRNGAQIFAPGRRFAWSIGLAGLILRSSDGGASWARQDSSASVDLLSGSAPSDTVCWVVGRAGTILLTTDGEHWSRVAPPGTQDWIGIRATDALHAVIWDFNRTHKFSTSDGGQTWQSAPQ